MARAPGGPEEIFVYGYYGCGNIGDELLLSAVIDGILARRPGSHFRVRNLGPTTPEEHQRALIRETGLEAIMLREDIGRVSKLVRYAGTAARAMRGCTCFVLGGGTLLHAGTSMGSLAITTLLVALARLKGIPVVGVGLGANHLDGRVARGLASVIRHLAADLAMRDARSVAAIGAGKRVRLTADLVPGWWPGPDAAPSTGHRDVVAVTLWSSRPRDEERALAGLADGLARASADGARVRALVFQDLAASGLRLSDRPAIERLAALLATRGTRVEIVRPAPGRAALAQAFSDVCVHVGARFHGSVVAALLGVPSVGLATDDKVASFCGELGLPSLAFEDIDGARLAEAIGEARERGVDREVMQRLRVASRSNFQWFDK